MQKAAGWLFAAALGLIILIVALVSRDLVPGFSYRQPMAEAAATTVTALLAVALFVERAMSVLNAILYGDTQRAAELGFTADKKEAAEDLARVLGHKERLRLIGAFLAALLVSAAGVRTLEGLLVTRGEGVPANAFLLPVDLVLTAALIAGGSNGLAFLLQLAKDRLSQPQGAATGGVAAPAARGAAGKTAAGSGIAALRARLTTTG
jgi:hypothetical protein